MQLKSVQPDVAGTCVRTLTVGTVSRRRPFNPLHPLQQRQRRRQIHSCRPHTARAERKDARESLAVGDLDAIEDLETDPSGLRVSSAEVTLGTLDRVELDMPAGEDSRGSVAEGVPIRVSLWQVRCCDLSIKFGLR